MWLRDNVGAPLAGGELAANVAEVDQALRAGVLGYLLPDVKHSGGPQRVARLIAEAEAAGVGISLHNPSGPVGTVASIHLCAALAPNSPLELMVGEAGDHPGPALPVDRVVDGFLPVPDGDGLGAGLLATSEERNGKRVVG
jgi:galactonate dehydratase